ncbi:MAG: polymerase subunit epsilon [Acidimicrobiaceae bacterium]|nr:polymerase subunit epsilon [Acidimicrobiaceae bacterium]
MATTARPPHPLADAAPVRAGALAEQRFAVIDVETTGLKASRHRIVQIAVVAALGDGTVVDRWSTLVNPPLGWVGASARRIHGLRAADLRRAPRFATIAGELVNRLDGAVLCAHNAGFDWAFVRRALRRCGYDTPHAARLCTMRLSRALDPDRLRAHRLSDLCDRYGVALQQAHDALSDAEAAAAVLPHLFAEARATTLDDLVPVLRRGSTEWPSYVERPALVRTARRVRLSVRRS